MQILNTRGSQVEELSEGYWRLTIPAGPAGEYRLAQLDDYRGLARSQFRWEAPMSLQLRARVSHQDLPGTWGFGLWNDPFAMGTGLRGTGRRLPALPHAAWFFHASPPNYLTLRDDRPGQGLLAATFCSRSIPTPLLAIGTPILPLLLVPWGRRVWRRLLRRVVQDDGVAMDVDSTQWHTYEIEWWNDHVCFELDGHLRFETPVVPQAPLGLVIWIDNQFAAFPPEGRPRFGTLGFTDPAWIEVNQLQLKAL